ncbi:ABC transporter substrate-binding protein [Streptomyces sp. enrichment culture]|uniref:ABC transporter substrate-binding protein n=1 Tax=Streptomyces sp. enrichment culture TaxID=1795815 RepID=UPI003F547623
MDNPFRYRLFYTVRQKIVTSVVVLALLAWGTVTVVQRVTEPEDRSCAPGVARPVGSEECVGVAVAGNGYDFGESRLTRVADAIGRENATLEEGQYTTVALLLPLTSTSPGLREKVLNELHGAFAQQYRANRHNNETPKIRLVLANTGKDNLHWKTAVDQLKDMTGEPHHLRAVSGIATSSTEVRSAVGELTGKGIAVVGTTITADDIANGPNGAPFPGLARVSPTNGDEAQALTRLDPVDREKTLLVHDTRTGDHYTDTLKNAFSQLLKGSPYEPQHFTSDTDPNAEGTTPREFREITQYLCVSPARTVFFAGRHTQLRQFINALGARGCKERKFLLLTGDEASYLSTDQQLNRAALESGLTVQYAALAHPDAWRARPGYQPPKTGGSAEAYDAFVQALEDVSKKPAGPLGPTNLADGQAIIAYDAMALAVRAIRAATPPGEMIPPLEEVRKRWRHIKGSLKVEGASGWICLDNYGNPYNKAVPVVQLTPDGPRFVKMAWPEGEAPDSDCLRMRRS